MGSLFQLSDLPAPVALDVPPDVLDLISSLLPGWDITPWRGEARDPVVFVETISSGEFVVGGRWAPSRSLYVDRVDTACAFIAELIRAYVNELPDRLWLHAAAAVYDGRLLVFPSARRSGKSTLCASIGASGRLIAGDDIILIDPDSGDGVAGGFCPRLRLPLPGSLGPATRSFIGRNCGPAGVQYAYLDLDHEQLAAKGDRYPIGAFILMDRTNSGPASLRQVDTSDALQAIIQQNFMRGQTPADILDRLFALIKATKAYRLTYSSADDAASLLDREFSSWPDDS